MYQLPSFLENQVAEDWYNRWLQRKAIAHLQRDKKRELKAYNRADYMRMIHEAVEASNGLDYYTGAPLHWHLLSKFENGAAAAHKGKYLREFDFWPTVDHEFSDEENFTFRICAWITNDCKNRLKEAEFIALCRQVLERHQARGIAAK